jgi:hypothetical protein
VLYPQKGPLSVSGPVVPARSVHLLMGRWRGFGAQLALVAFALLLAVFGLVQGLSHLQRPGGLAGQLLRRKPVIAAASVPARVLALLLGLLLGGLPGLLLPGRLLLLLLLLGWPGCWPGCCGCWFTWFCGLCCCCMAKSSFSGERQAGVACLTDRGELSGATFAAFEATL